MKKMEGEDQTQPTIKIQQHQRKIANEMIGEIK